ncbi:hypothetical protein AWR29_08735 [Campylobacter fetus subsp. venerealis]|nr:hypothetical protein AWR29_08735 [Campylobacter fetus subsp. venerealis]
MPYQNNEEQIEIKEIELPFKIVVKNIDGLSKNNKKVINLGSYENKEVGELLNTLKIIDLLEQQRSKEKMEFCNEYIEFNIVTQDKEIPLNIKLGEGNFTKGIDHLIKIGSLELKENTINSLNPETKVTLNKFLNPKIDKKILDNLLNGGLKAAEIISEPLDKNLTQFITEFYKTYTNALEIKKGSKSEINKNKDSKKDEEIKSKGQIKTKEYFLNKFSDFFKKNLVQKRLKKSVLMKKAYLNLFTKFRYNFLFK